MWLSQEMSELEANSFEASAFQVQLKKSEEYSICAGQSLVFLTFSVACIQVMTRIGSRAPGGNRMQRHKAVRDTRVPSFHCRAISSTDNLGPFKGEQSSPDRGQMS